MAQVVKNRRRAIFAASIATLALGMSSMPAAFAQDTVEATPIANGDPAQDCFAKVGNGKHGHQIIPEFKTDSGVELNGSETMTLEFTANGETARDVFGNCVDPIVYNLKQGIPAEGYTTPTYLPYWDNNGKPIKYEVKAIEGTNVEPYLFQGLPLTLEANEDAPADVATIEPPIQDYSRETITVKKDPEYTPAPAPAPSEGEGGAPAAGGEGAAPAEGGAPAAAAPRPATGGNSSASAAAPSRSSASASTPSRSGSTATASRSGSRSVIPAPSSGSRSASTATRSGSAARTASKATASSKADDKKKATAKASTKAKSDKEKDDKKATKASASKSPETEQTNASGTSTKKLANSGVEIAALASIAALALGVGSAMYMRRKAS